MELKAQLGGDLALGGADLAAAFMRHGLIDEYRLNVHPIVIGQGKPLFSPSNDKIDLRPAEIDIGGRDPRLDIVAGRTVKSQRTSTLTRDRPLVI